MDERAVLLMPYGLANRQPLSPRSPQHDAERLPDYDAALERAADVLRDLVLQTPPNAGGGIDGVGPQAAVVGRRLLACRSRTSA